MHSAEFAIATFLALVVAQFLHAWLLASNAVHSPLNGIKTYKQYIEVNAAVITFRFALAWAILAIYNWHYLDICLALSKISYLSWLAGHPIPVSPPVAMIYGLFADPLINTLFVFLSKWVPGLNTIVPPTANGKNPVPPVVP